MLNIHHRAFVVVVVVTVGGLAPACIGAEKSASSEDDSDGGAADARAGAAGAAGVASEGGAGASGGAPEAGAGAGGAAGAAGAASDAGTDASSGPTFVGFAGPLTWDDAEADCVAHGGHLASIHSVAENALVMDACTVVSPKGACCWTALQPLYGWQDGTPMDYHAGWSPLEISGACGGITPEQNATYPGTWGKISCNTFLPYVCKLP